MAPVKTEPRKRPKQSRSRVLYDALIEATGRLLASEGVAAVTTARVAELAGVSIGSLYQYFPSREALIAAVIDAKLERDMQELVPILDGLRLVALDQAVRGLVEVAVRYYRDETPLYREMVAALAAVDREAHVRRLLEGFDKVIVVVLEPHRAALHDGFERSAWIMREMLISCVRAAAREHPETLADGYLAARLEAMCRGLLGLDAA
ncbi:Transcriptional regulator, TetR family protein [Enhygromyxa salina]|uniref:Transcriptional regulator, TetR family protein n=1 Tax=Enhygromyxa salina TaxID=215803 RepID=A0A0C2D2R0_9BACT|nr:TetR/AcrR family transcriptional regulator [Enhygromyxa salina]KIG16055.1 Transcriptional regulator, TetR family protein [Enhygromyxa salina]